VTLDAFKIAVQGVGVPLTPIALAVQGLIAEIQQEQEELDRLKRYKEMGLGYVRKQRQPDTKARKKRAQIEREQRIIEDDEEVLLTLVAALEMME
jgi:hypothetical protein